MWNHDIELMRPGYSTYHIAIDASVGLRKYLGGLWSSTALYTHNPIIASTSPGGVKRGVKVKHCPKGRRSEDSKHDELQEKKIT